MHEVRGRKTAHKKEGRSTHYNAAQKGTATGDGLRGCRRPATLIKAAFALVLVHETAIMPFSTARNFAPTMHITFCPTEKLMADSR